MKSARNSSAKRWEKIVNIRPELSAVSDIMLPGLPAGYYELQKFLKSEYDIN